MRERDSEKETAEGDSTFPEVERNADLPEQRQDGDGRRVGDDEAVWTDEFHEAACPMALAPRLPGSVPASWYRYALEFLPRACRLPRPSFAGTLLALLVRLPSATAQYKFTITQSMHARTRDKDWRAMHSMFRVSSTTRRP